ncbi:hypothetical protein OAG68_00115 [bacterium]|nr:hypothetical protein [bacterium]
MENKCIISSPIRHNRKPLEKLFPDEFAFFKDRFIWTGRTQGFYTRRAYEPARDDFGRPYPKWRPFKTRGDWQQFYPDLVDALVEKHLDFGGYYRPPTDWLSLHDSETAFWLGTMAGRNTYHDCIDIDSHEVVGWLVEPTRWHPDINPRGGIGPWSGRYVPVVRPTMRFFHLAKLVYETFPNRTWSFSSANLGFAVWRMNSYTEPTHVAFRRTENLLKGAGLSLEHYPMPPSGLSTFGKCHRRPCGMDTGLISSDGVITYPVQQIQCFMSPPKTPSFRQIMEAWFQQLNHIHNRFLEKGGSLDHEILTESERKEIIEKNNETVDKIWHWHESGCVIDPQLIAGNDGQAIKADPVVEFPNFTFEDAPVLIDDVGSRLDSKVIPDTIDDIFSTLYIKAATGSGRWIQFVKSLVDNGIPVKDKFSEAISVLALWFGFVELFGKDRERIKQVLHAYALSKHNGKVSRLLAEGDTLVLSHVDRIVDSVLDNEDNSGKRIFAEIRQKRASGSYKNLYYFEEQILNSKQDSDSSLVLPSPLSYLLCGGVNQEKKGNQEWVYIPDNTPLPDILIKRIKSAFKKSDRQLRINTSTNRYPTIDTITRFFNYLFAGRKCGTRRASQVLLVLIGFPKKTNERKAVINVLVENKLLYEGSYQGSKSKQWILDKSVIKQMFAEKSEKKRSAS